MRDLTVKKLHEIVGGRLRLATLPPRYGEATRVQHVVTDSRQVHQGGVFWGLSGTRLDGSNFAFEAYSRGATGVVVEKKYVQPWPGGWSLEVNDSLAALEKLARWNRQRMAGRVVAVTGSVGKTTARQMIRAVLDKRYRGTSSPKNFNNHVGLPLSMLAIEPPDDFAVLELAASAPGEIARLAALCRPQVAVITQLGEAHLGGFGSLDAVAEAKCELLASLDADGWAVLAGDDARLRRFAATRRERTYLVRPIARERSRGHPSRESRRPSELRRSTARRCRSTLWGRHHLAGALAAVAVGRIFGLSDQEICRRPCRLPTAADALPDHATSAARRSSTTPTTPAPRPCVPRSSYCAISKPPAGASSSAATCASWAKRSDELHRQLGDRGRHALRRRLARGLRRTLPRRGRRGASPAGMPPTRVDGLPGRRKKLYRSLDHGLLRPATWCWSKDRGRWPWNGWCGLERCIAQAPRACLTASDHWKSQEGYQTM